MRPILFLKSNDRHDARGRFARAAADGERGAGAGTMPVRQDDPARPVALIHVSASRFAHLDQKAARLAAEGEADALFTLGRDQRNARINTKVVNQATGWTIEVGHKGASHAARMGEHEQLAVIPAIPEMMRHAPWMQFAPDRDDTHSVIGYHRFLHPIAVDGRPYVAQITVQQTAPGRRYYHHQLMLIPLAFGRMSGGSGGDGSPLTGFAPSDPPDRLTVGDLRQVFKLIHGGGGAAELAKAMPAGARWITVRPNGPGTEGHAVMIQPSGDGAYRVIGGAGGKLNYLKLTGVRSEAEYASRAKDRAKESKEAKKRQTARDREAGLVGVKTQARENLRLADRAARDDFVKQVAAALDWKPEDTRFRHEDHQDVPQSELDRMQAEHFDKLYTVAQKAVDVQRQRILADADMRSEAGLASVPLTAPEDPEALSVADLDPIEGSGGGRGLGFLPRYDERAAARGADPEQIREEAAAVTGKPLPPKPDAPPPAEQPALPGTEAAVDTPAENSGLVAEGEAQPNPKAGAEGQPPEAAETTAPDPEQPAPDVAPKMAEALDAIRAPIGPKVDPKAKASAKAAMQLLRAQRELRAKLKQVKARAKEIDKAGSKDEVEPNAFVIEVDGKAVDEAVTRGVEEELRTIRTRGFLNEATTQGAVELHKHVAVGAFNSLNSLAIAAGGAALLDRSVVDVLGPEAASQALAHRLAADLPASEMAHIREAMGRFHVDHYMARSHDALEEARDLQEQAAEIGLGEASNGHDLAVAQELNQRRREMTNRSKTILAQALGEMETNAALVTALERPKRDRITVSLGTLAPADAIVRLRAIGLDRGDYTLERAGKSTILVIAGEAIGKLTAPIAQDDITRVNGALSIMQGHEDEDGWLPKGVAVRPDFGRDVPAGSAPRLARPFPSSPADVGQAVRDYIGGRAADGDAPADIMAGLLAEDVIQRAGDRAGFMAAVNQVAPLYDGDGKMIRAESHAEAFQGLADDFTQRAYGGVRTPIHRQAVEQDRITAEALHRALAKTPEGAAAFKPVGDLSPQEQAGLRAVFDRDFGKVDPAGKEKRAALAKLDGEEPEKETDGMFGRQPNPDWAAWKTERDGAAEAANAAEMTWQRYSDTMGSPQAAYRAMQDVTKGRVMADFAENHNRMRPDQPIRSGRTNISGDLQHLDALDPKAREKRQELHRGMVDRLRNRVGGQYSSGSVADKIAAAREAEEAAAQSQMGLFGDEPAAPASADPNAPLPEDTSPMGQGERATVGHAAERVLAGMAQRIGRNFKPGQPISLYAPDMSGKYVARQRAVKLIAKNRRIMLGMGVGSGKTSISLGAFTHLKETGKAKRGLFLVPSVVQGQFHGEALTMLEPGRYDWHAAPGASREERIAALKDPKRDFNVVTHQSFRDDVLHLASQQHGGTPEAMADRLAGMAPEERQAFVKDVLHREGIDHDFLAVDEGHNLLNRKGKQNSRMADVIDGVAHGMGTYVNMTADPVKNDASEVFDTLAKMDPARYSDRNAFMRRYGVDTDSARDGLRREMARHYYTSSIDPGVEGRKQEIPVQLHPEDHARITAINEAAGAARMARMEGRTDIAAMKALSPNSFANLPPEQHEAAAARLQDAIGVVRDAAMRHAINGRGKVDALVKEAAARKGKPGVVFCHHLDRVEDIAARLKAEGHRVVTMTGKHSSKEKDRIKREYQRGDHDILVVSDAGAVGANLQHGKWLAQFDTPMTAMVHAQRNGRIHRIGQKEDVDLLDLVADHPEERRARDRLTKKYGLRDIVTSPLDGLDDTGLAGMLHRIRAGKADAVPAPEAAPTEAERKRAAAPESAQPELV